MKEINPSRGLLSHAEVHLSTPLIASCGVSGITIAAFCPWIFITASLLGVISTTTSKVGVLLSPFWGEFSGFR